MVRSHFRWFLGKICFDRAMRQVTGEVFKLEGVVAQSAVGN